MSEKIVQLNEEVIKGQIKELVAAVWRQTSCWKGGGVPDAGCPL